MALQLRRATAADASTSNPTLAIGEPGFETDTLRLKIGNGTTDWDGLPYSDDLHISPVFAYNVDGSLNTITYANGTVKTFTYNVNGDVSQIDHDLGGYTIRKTFAYDVDGNLESITQTKV